MSLEEKIRTPQFTFGLFLGIFILLMSYYGKEVESRTYIISRCVLMLLLWILVVVINKKGNSVAGWIVALFFMAILMMNLWQRVKYTSDTTHQDTLQKVIEYRTKEVTVEI